MKTYILAAVLAVVACLLWHDVFASTVTLPPPPAPVQNVHFARCAAEGFTDAGVAGACQYTLNCSARGCHPAAYTYAVTWTLNAVATLGALRAASPAFVTDATVSLDGHTYYYVASSPLGAILAGTGYSALLWQP